MEFQLSIVDAFIVQNKPFSGNAAAVCILQFDDDISDDIKQKIASEMNISETAFVAKAWNKNSKQETNKYTLRWFTPTSEIELCGHATLASAKVIFDKFKINTEINDNKIQFETKFKGILEAVIDSTEESITLNFPLNVCEPFNRETNPWINGIIENILGQELGTDVIEEVEYSSGAKMLLLRLKDRSESEKIIEKIKPNYEKLLEIKKNIFIYGVIVTQKGESAHFMSRYFAPWIGVNEDPVTGSAHTVLAPYWKRQLEKSGHTFEELIGEQCSKRRGTVICKIEGQRVYLKGNTKTFLNGIIQI